MPSVKPAPKAQVKPEIALALFAKNLEAIRVWYRGASYSGHVVGHVVVNELVLANVSVALSLAIDGREWTQPENAP